MGRRMVIAVNEAALRPAEMGRALGMLEGRFSHPSLRNRAITKKPRPEFRVRNGTYKSALCA
jgi:hypothetical protein